MSLPNQGAYPYKSLLHPPEQLETLYSEAVTASADLARGNVQLKRTFDVNKSSRLYISVFFLIASLSLLLFDWWAG